jgi:hypothetical protein
MIQTFDPVDPPTADEFHRAPRILPRNHGVDGPEQRAIMVCLHGVPKRVGVHRNS